MHFVSARVCVSADNNNIALFGEVGGEELYCKAATVPYIGQITVPHSMIYIFPERRILDLYDLYDLAYVAE